MALPQLAQRVGKRNRGEKGKKSHFLILGISAFKNKRTNRGKWERGRKSVFILRSQGGLPAGERVMLCASPELPVWGWALSRTRCPPCQPPRTSQFHMDMFPDRCISPQKGKKQWKGRRKGGKTHRQIHFTSSQKRSQGLDASLCSCTNKFGLMQR